VWGKDGTDNVTFIGAGVCMGIHEFMAPGCRPICLYFKALYPNMCFDACLCGEKMGLTA
jgi:hypothetical protein